MITEVKGNILHAEADLIAHGCNTLGVMGAGVAKALRSTWPEIFPGYHALCKQNADHRTNLLGTIHLASVKQNALNPRIRYVANLFTQLNIGRDRRQVDYNAVESCLKILRQKIDRLNTEEAYYDPILHIAMPRIGCNLAGGDWNIVSKIIETTLGDWNIDVTIHTL